MDSLIAKLLEANHPLATRDAFGLALRELGQHNPQIVVLDADLAHSTRARLFAKQFPERFFNVGIAEQDMVSIGAGLASCGKIPIVVTYATFLVGRGLDQIRNMVAYGHLNVKLIGSHAGLATGEDGATHQALEDIGIMRGIPGLRVISPSDAIETIKSLEFAINSKGPIYLRLTREKTELIHHKDYQFQFGQLEIFGGFVNKKVALLATGTMVIRALQAAKLLEKEDIDTCVVNVHTIKPLNTKTLTKIAQEVDLIVTVEDHNITGGLGTAIGEFLSGIKTKAILKKFGIDESFGESGNCQELYFKHQLTAEQIAKRILKILERN